jgi:hypothetical protein
LCVKIINKCCSIIISIKLMKKHKIAFIMFR